MRSTSRSTSRLQGIFRTAAAGRDDTAALRGKMRMAGFRLLIPRQTNKLRATELHPMKTTFLLLPAARQECRRRRQESLAALREIARIAGLETTDSSTDSRVNVSCQRAAGQPDFHPVQDRNAHDCSRLGEETPVSSKTSRQSFFILHPALSIRDGPPFLSNARPLGAYTFNTLTEIKAQTNPSVAWTRCTSWPRQFPLVTSTT